MSKNIQIKEGNSPKVFNGVRKIRINDYPSGSSTWVPEDETVLGTKNINANGEYIASEEVDSETHENKGWYGYSKVTVNMSSRLGTKSINENGTYKASEEVDEETHQSKGWYGYSQVTVRGVGKGSYTAKEGDHLNGQDLEENEDYNLDENGATLVPKKIKVTQKPTKYEYIHGEDIDITGIVVKAYKENNELWTDIMHPDGILNVNELEFAPTKADLGQVSRIDYTDEDGLNATKLTIKNETIKMTGGGAQDGMENRYVFPQPLWIHHSNIDGDTEGYLDFNGSGEYLVTRYNNMLYIHRISGANTQTVRWWRIVTGNKWQTIYIGTSQDNMSSTRFLPAVQGSTSGNEWDWHPNVITWIPPSTKDPTTLTAEQVSNLKEVGGKQKITIIYNREDGKELTDILEIDVDPIPSAEEDEES